MALAGVGVSPEPRLHRANFLAELTGQQKASSLRGLRGLKASKDRVTWQRQWSVDGLCHLCGFSILFKGLRCGFRSTGNRGELGRASFATTLLVDGDQHIRLENDMANALASLVDEGRCVNATVFGVFSDKTEATLKTSPKLRKYVQIGKNLCVKTVQRMEQSLARQPNDEAIISEMHKLSMQPAGPQCIALLVSDGDFAPAMRHAMSHGKEVVVFVPNSKQGAEGVFKSAGARVVRLPPHQENRYYKVQALLNADGTGYVRTTSPIPHSATDSTSLRDFLSHFGYCEAEARPDSLCSAMAKFWYANELGGSFIVYPYNQAHYDFKKILIKHQGQQWQPYGQKLAFFLPTNGGRRLSKTKIQEYGHGFGRCVYRGGGPFMLEDSDTLVEEALRQLGFLDNDLNSNFVEAMLVFCNTSNNKGALLRMGLLPGSSASTAQQNLREAFVSSPSGMWESPPSDLEVRHVLSKEQFLREDANNQQLVFDAMKKYAQKHKLREMESYHGLVWRILRSLDRNHLQRETIEFRFEEQLPMPKSLQSVGVVGVWWWWETVRVLRLAALSL